MRGAIGSITLLGLPGTESFGIAVLAGTAAVDVVLAAVLVALSRRTGSALATAPGDGRRR